MWVCYYVCWIVDYGGFGRNVVGYYVVGVNYGVIIDFYVR